MKGKSLTLRLAPGELAELRRMARADARSMASLVKKWLKDALEKEVTNESQSA